MRVWLACLSLIIYGSVQAQSDQELLRYSLTGNYSTARNIGLGGAFNALGGDFASLSTNPAGIGRYTGLEFTITPAISIANVNSTFLSSPSEDNRLKFNLNNIGAIIPLSSITKSQSTLKLGIGLNRLANFNEQFYVNGYNVNNSLLNSFAERLEGESVSSAENNFPFDASLAYLAELLVADVDLNYFTATNNGNVTQEITLERAGGIDEVALSMGGTAGKVHIGGTIGLPILRYEEGYFHRERDINDSAQGFNFFEFTRILHTDGIGLNLKLGVIGEISDYLRLGAAFHTPTLYWMDDNFISEMYSDFDTFFVEATSPEGTFEYRMTTPWKANIGAAFIHPDHGLISLEYELSDPGMAKYRFSDNNPDAKDFQEIVNDLNRAKYKITSTIKAGIEYKIKDFRLRAGMHYRTSPFADDYKPDGVKTSAIGFAGGFGYRGKNFFADIAYHQMNYEEQYLPYTLSLGTAPVAVHTWKKPSIIFTLGYKL